MNRCPVCETKIKDGWEYWNGLDEEGAIAEPQEGNCKVCGFWFQQRTGNLDEEIKGEVKYYVNILRNRIPILQKAVDKKR